MKGLRRAWVCAAAIAALSSVSVARAGEHDPETTAEQATEAHEGAEHEGAELSLYTHLTLPTKA
jgi:hypothetical protein